MADFVVLGGCVTDSTHTETTPPEIPTPEDISTNPSVVHGVGQEANPDQDMAELEAMLDLIATQQDTDQYTQSATSDPFAGITRGILATAFGQEVFDHYTRTSTNHSISVNCHDRSVRYTRALPSYYGDIVTEHMKEAIDKAIHIAPKKPRMFWTWTSDDRFYPHEDVSDGVNSQLDRLCET